MATNIEAYCLAFDSSDRLYVPDYNANSVAVDSKTVDHLLTTITDGITSPIAIAITP